MQSFSSDLQLAISAAKAGYGNIQKIDAGLIIVEEAGGKVTDWKGNRWNNTNSFILASNGKIHDEIVAEVKDLQ